jgi:prolyl-tRNA synthetase
VLPAEIFLAATGIQPNIDLARAAGLEVRRGVIVDAGMRTSAADIFAAGDVCEFADEVPGLWAVAVEQARVAAAITKNEEEPVKVHGRKDSFEELCFASKDRLHQSVMIDARQGLRLGEKTFHAIHAGIPVRVELGAKELKEKKCVIKSRIRQREDAVTVTLDEAPDVIHEMLATDHQKLFAHALQRMQSRIVRPKDFKELKTAINDGNFVEIPWDGTKETVEKLKEETSGGTIRCFAFDAKEDARTDNDPVSQKPSAFAKRVLVGKAY